MSAVEVVISTMAAGSVTAGNTKIGVTNIDTDLNVSAVPGTANNPPLVITVTGTGAASSVNFGGTAIDVNIVSDGSEKVGNTKINLTIEGVGIFEMVTHDDVLTVISKTPLPGGGVPPELSATGAQNGDEIIWAPVIIGGNGIPRMASAAEE